MSTDFPTAPLASRLINQRAAAPWKSLLTSPTKILTLPIDYIKIYTYYQSKRQSILLHQAKYLTPASKASPSPDALTGVNHLYSPSSGRELQYGCALFEVAP